METLHQPGEIIAEKYCILNTLGQGGIATTYEAQDLKNSQKVALKALSLRRMHDWKKMELFEREARILSQLNHPAIPKYLDYFQVDTAQDRSFYIAQQLAPGQSLAVLVENGWRPDSIEIWGLAIQVLKILIYLHSFTPPVIHRDIKPQNIIRQENGRVFLVDFGAVQDTYHNTVTGGSTVVRTYGYMAPEQFRGQAVLSTDLYGLGTTLLFLLTRKPPSDLPQRKLKIDFRSQVRMDKDFADWLEKMLEPVIEDRFLSAKEALAVLRCQKEITTSQSRIPRLPKNSTISFTETNGKLIITILPVWLSNFRSRLVALLSLVGNGGILVLLIMLKLIPITSYSISLNPYTFLFALLFLITCPLWGPWMLFLFLFGACSHTKIEIDKEYIHITQHVLGLCYQKQQRRTEEINQVKLSEISPFKACLIRLKLRKFPLSLLVTHEYRFGLFLTQQDKLWLVASINSFLEKIREP